MSGDQKKDLLRKNVIGGSPEWTPKECTPLNKTQKEKEKTTTCNATQRCQETKEHGALA